MRNNNITCDRCGNAITEVTQTAYHRSGYGDTWRLRLSWAKLQMYPPEMPKGIGAPQRIDLCENCYDRFVTWLESND